MKLKFTLKEIIAGIIFVGTISGGWVAVKVNQDNMQMQVNKLEKSINDKLKILDERTFKILELLAND